MASSMLQLAILLALFMGDSSAPDAGRPKDDAPPVKTEGAQPAVRIARSDDGLTFKASDVLLQNARVAGLVRLGNGDLLALVEQTSAKGERTLAASRSKDDGKTWLEARPIRLTGLPEVSQIESAALAVMPSGLVRLYFSVAGKAQRAKARAGVVICSAVTRDGVEYQLDRQVRLQCDAPDHARLSAYWGDKQMVLLVGSGSEVGKAASGRAVAQQFLSTDGRVFGRPERARFAGTIGPVARIDRHQWRMYIAADNEIRSRTSSDAVRWRDETGVCLRGAAHAAVTSTTDKKYLMLVEGPLDAGSAKLPELAAARAPTKSQAGAVSEAGEGGSGGGQQQDAPPAANSAPGTGSASAGWDAFAEGGYEQELGADWRPAAGGASGSAATSGGDDLAPIPDFQNRIDYVGWFTENAIVPDGENAYFSYDPVLQGIPAREEKINDMFNDPEPGLRPGPWNPADRPLWEESYQATQDLMEQYAAAARDGRRFSSPIQFSENSDPENRMLLELLLPSLSTMRAACKATLAQAWRAPEGTVPPEQMRTAIETVIGNANHLRQGATLIERLVGVAERNMAHQNARLALQQGVFGSADELEATLNVLRESDTPDPDPGSWARFEHAAAMDMVQYVFSPSEPGGEPQIQPDRLSRLGLISGGDSVPVETEALGQLKYDARADAEAMTDYYRQTLEHFRTKFPYESADHLETLATEKGEQHAIAKMMLPSLARAGEMLRRAEADRRATQLVYSVELFRARNGRYPGSLDELPGEQVSDVRTDPYSGRDFAYRLTESGATIYSLSNNGQDDGGVHSKRWGDDRAGQSDDFVFWPPQE